MLAPGNLFRNWAIDALDRAGIPWRIVMSSTSIAAVEAAAAAGIAITVVKSGTAQRGLRILATDHGLPRLPLSEIALHQAPGSPSPAARQLATFMRSRLAAA